MATSINAEQLQQLAADGAQIVDVLPPEEYAAAHIPGAINLPLRKLTAETAGQLDRERAVVVYCWDGL